MKLQGTLVGCGFFAENHLSAWADLDVGIVAVCDHDRNKASAAASRFGIPKFYTDADEMLARERPAFVDVVTTVESHRGLIEMAARHGIPVICQKPFATNLTDAAAMVEACARARVPLMVHENFRWQVPLMAVAAELRAGSIGTPFFGRISFRHDFDVYKVQPYLAEVEHFAILDVGIHLLDVARSYFGEVKRLSCSTQSVDSRVRGEDVATILLEHESGASSIVDCSFSSRLDPNPFPQTLVEIDGTDGSIRLSEGYRMQVVSTGRSISKDVDAPVASWMVPPWHVVQNSVVNIQRHWLECLMRGEEPATSGTDNLRTLALGFAAYESAELSVVTSMADFLARAALKQG